MIATFDLGTTAVKGVLTDENGQVFENFSVNIDTIYEGDHKEQDPNTWYDAFCQISRKFVTLYPKEQIEAIIMSGQMQDVILVDKDFEPVCNAILYSDGRASEEAEWMVHEVGAEYLERSTGNHYDGSLPLPKLIWVKKNMPKIWEKTAKVLISSKDFVIGKLTEIAAGDVTACATAGAMDIRKKVWDEKILNTAGISYEKMSNLYHAHELVGELTEKALQETGYGKGIKVFAGAGDAGATTLASGICREGEYNINLGTSGWVAAVSASPIQTAGGVFNLSAMPEETYINVVPFLNAGNVHHWISELLTEEGREKIDYEGMETLLKNAVPGSHGVLFLPYLSGERFPVLDADAKGVYFGLTPQTGKEDLLSSALEAVAFSIRQGIESLGAMGGKISVIGGGARSEGWCQILANVFGSTIYVYRNADVLPALAIASAALIGLGKLNSYEDFTEKLQSDDYSISYEPDENVREIYDTQYLKYQELYPALKNLFQKNK